MSTPAGNGIHDNAALLRQAETLRDLRHRRRRLERATRGAPESTPEWRKVTAQYDQRLVAIARTLAVDPPGTPPSCDERRLLSAEHRTEIELRLAGAGVDFWDPRGEVFPN